ncbi:unnamed protein product [Porites lobata]|uniref:C2 NT-type domain-containing protein n=1 Tax=Porites lobata TaxID=104759 RepID=A0ABN8N5W1_9CNID|nr:unnamed protein product [Porites lobata]
MSSVIQKIKRNKSNARDFQITASVNLLTIECQPDKWHPNKLIILWGQQNKSCQTKPVPWQPGFVYPYRGTHVWPEPDPVKNTFKVFKNTKRAGNYYEDRPWKIVVKNECKDGRRQLIATGCIDLADYISQTNKTFYMTVTLKPAMKNVLSGTIDFNLTVTPCQRNEESQEIFREIMADAFKSAKQRIAKNVSSTKHRDPLLFSFVDKPSEIPYTPKKRKSKKRRTKDRAINTSDSNNAHEREKEKKNSSQPPQPVTHPYRSDEDAIREIMADAIRSAKQRIAKAASYTEHIDPFLFSFINKPSEDPTSGKERADDTVDNANNDYGRKAKVENKSPLPARLAATAPALNDVSSGCGEKGDMPPHGSGTSGQLTAPDALENGPEQAASMNYLELSAYVSAEMKSLQEEIASLRKVTVKLESEMHQAMEIKECKEELDGLKQDWMILLSYIDELEKRKADLQILENQENLEHCCDVLRNDLKLIFTMEVKGESTSGTREGFAASQIVYTGSFLKDKEPQVMCIGV